MTNILILDYSKWRCGFDGKTAIGDGPTRLANNCGYCCCLGLFSPQINPSIEESDLLGRTSPGEIEKRVAFLNYKDRYKWVDTKLSKTAMNINDNEETTPEEKIKKLRELFATKGFKIRVINKPKD